MKRLFLIIVVALFFATSGVYAQDTTGTFTDSRDGEVYPTISFGDSLMGISVTWMARNLNYKISLGCWAYNDDEQYRENFGLLYDWETAKNVCPDGWHLPTDDEWQTLIEQFGGEDKAGTALKSTQGWKDGGNGDNSSGFNALPAGFLYDGDGSFYGLGMDAYFWTSSPSDSEFAWVRSLYYNYGKVYRNYYGRTYGFFVRCVRN